MDFISIMLSRARLDHSQRLCSGESSKFCSISFTLVCKRRAALTLFVDGHVGQLLVPVFS